MRSCKILTVAYRRTLVLVIILTILSVLIVPSSALATQDTLPAYLEQEQVPATKYHLTARPWVPMESENYLDIVEEIARWWTQQEDPQIPGRILDPFGPNPFGWPPTSGYPQITTGTFPFSVAILYKAGQARELLDLAIRVMDYETRWYAERVARKNNPNSFRFSDGQVAAVEVLRSISAISPSKLDSWRSNLSVPTNTLPQILAVNGSPNSFCYRMLGEWNRYRMGLGY